jgi:hypothetical protein
LVEVRQYLAEASPLFLFANFHFEVNNRRVNEYQDIGSNGIVDESVISIILGEHIGFIYKMSTMRGALASTSRRHMRPSPIQGCSPSSTSDHKSQAPRRIFPSIAAFRKF